MQKNKSKVPSKKKFLKKSIKKELDNRLERHKSGKTKYYTLDEVKSMLAQKRK